MERDWNKELLDLMARNQEPPTNQCLLKASHRAHYWWYTSWGGGHMLGGEPAIEDLKYEKGLKRHLCLGIKPQQSRSTQP